MKPRSFKRVSGGVIAPRGFLCSAVRCGLKTKSGALDLGIIVSELPAAAAAVFTTNRVQAAAVQLDRELLKKRKVIGIVVNAGNANACTGTKGMRDARRMSQLAQQATGSTGDFFVSSTGIIGRPLPMLKVEQGILAAASNLGRTKSHAKEIAGAIMTTDLAPKSEAVEIAVGGKKVRIGGIAKGSGMIAPNMATMLCFITSDCAITAGMLQRALDSVVPKTFNSITVDGDCSTNDTVALLANGAAGNATIAKAGKEFDLFREGLLFVAESLSKAIVRDGEGASKFVEVLVTGAKSESEARLVAEKISNSSLVKCAINGCDPNWGRIICAAGYSGVDIDPARLRLWINGLKVFANAMPTAVAPARLAACMKPKEIFLKLDLGRGKQQTRMWTCDLSKEYVSINADYHT